MISKEELEWFTRNIKENENSKIYDSLRTHTIIGKIREEIVCLERELFSKELTNENLENLIKNCINTSTFLLMLSTRAKSLLEIRARS